MMAAVTIKKDGQRLPHKEMLTLAGVLSRNISAVSPQVMIAGSIRRGEPMCGDIEIVALQTDELYIMLDEWLAAGHIEQRLKSNGSRIAWGKKYRAFWVTDPGSGREVAVDVFMPTFDGYGATLLLRTGGAEFNKAIVTPISKGGAMPESVEWVKGRLYDRSVSNRAMSTQREVSAFRVLNIPYLPPYARTVANAKRLAKFDWRGLTYALRCPRADDRRFDVDVLRGIISLRSSDGSIQRQLDDTPDTQLVIKILRASSEGRQLTPRWWPYFESPHEFYIYQPNTQMIVTQDQARTFTI